MSSGMHSSCCMGNCIILSFKYSNRKEKIYLYFAVVSSASHRELHCSQQRAMQRLWNFWLRAAVGIAFDVGKIDAVFVTHRRRCCCRLCFYYFSRRTWVIGSCCYTFCKWSSVYNFYFCNWVQKISMSNSSGKFFFYGIVQIIVI